MALQLTTLRWTTCRTRQSDCPLLDSRENFNLACITAAVVNVKTHTDNDGYRSDSHNYPDRGVGQPGDDLLVVNAGA